jgi:N-acetylneuraminate lyase
MIRFQGVWPALVTPFTKDNKINTSVINDLVDHFLDKNVDGFYVCGSTGQGLFQSVQERKLVTETVVERVNKRVPVVVHIGSSVIGDAIELAVHAQDIGASGISSVIPAYYNDLEPIFQYYKHIAENASKISLWPYFWSDTKQNRLTLIKDLMRVPTIKALKYTGPDMYEMSQIIDLCDENWTVFSGMDEQCVLAAMFGAHGCIGTTVNLFPIAYQKIRNGVAAGNYQQAVDLQKRLNRVITIMYQYNFRGSLAEMLRKMGFECGEPRLPHHPIHPEQQQALWNDLDKAGYQELVSL